MLACIGWFMGFSMIIFVPLDLYTTFKDNKPSDWLVWWWEIFYWSSFVLNYTIFPYAIAYIESSEFTQRGKIMAALKSQIPIYIIELILGAALMTYLYFSARGQEIV